MPAKRKGARLWLRPARAATARSKSARAVFIIIDGSRHIATGCFAGETEKAEQALQAYIAGKYAPARRERALAEIPVADVLSIYLDLKDPSAGRPKFRARIARLNDFFGSHSLDFVTGESCRDYLKARGRAGGTRRDLEDLRAAINHHHAEGFHREAVRVVLPPKGRARERWLTRAEAAALLWTCWRRREMQKRHRGRDTGRIVETGKYPLRHIARFILIGLYTGSRAGAIASASPQRGGGKAFVDLDRGIFYRRAPDAAETNKRQPPVPIPPRLLAHLRRWHRLGIAAGRFVEWNGNPVKSVKTGFGTAVRLSKIAHASPHTLRHTAATWLMQNGAPIWQAAGFLGMSEKTLRDTYGHHHPDFMSEAVAAIGGKPLRREALVQSLVPHLERAAGPQKKP